MFSPLLPPLNIVKDKSIAEATVRIERWRILRE
jgi:hypothetical protein